MTAQSCKHKRYDDTQDCKSTFIGCKVYTKLLAPTRRPIRFYLRCAVFPGRRVPETESAWILRFAQDDSLGWIALQVVQLLRLFLQVCRSRKGRARLPSPSSKKLHRSGFANVYEIVRTFPSGAKARIFADLIGTAEAMPFPTPFMKPALREEIA